MTPDAYFTPLKGQSLLLPGQNENVRGECVQSAGYWIMQQGGQMPAYQYAYMYWDKGIPGYDKIPAGNPVKMGDTIVWGKNFPSSPGAGHIDSAAADGTIQNFPAWDSNWSPPLKLNRITHTGSDNNYIVGYLRKKGQIGMPTEQQVRDYFLTYVQGLGGAPPTQKQINDYTSQTIDHLLSDLLQYDYDYAVQSNIHVADLEKQLAAQGTTLKPGKYIVS